MKKGIALILAAVMILGLTACGKVLKSAEYFKVSEQMENGDYAAAFFPEDLTVSDDGCVLTVTLYDYDRYDLAAVQNLKAGDSISVQGNDVKIDTIETDDIYVTINGELEDGGVTLVEEGGYYRTMTWDDYPLYVERGTVTLPVDENLSVADRGGDDPTCDTLLGSVDRLAANDFYPGVWTQFNTTITVEDGKITAIFRDWTP